MKAALRITVFLVAALVVLFGVVAAYLLLVFDPNDYRDRIAAEVRQQTGRELVIAGDIGLSVFPWLGVEVERLRLGDAPGFGDEPFASVERAELRARLLPLLGGDIDVDRVVLHGLALRLVRDADGRGNWEDLAGDAQPQAAPSGDRRDGPDLRIGAAAFAVGEVEIESASVSLDDRQAGVRHEVSNLSLRSGEIRPGVAFPLEIGLDVASSAPDLRGRLDLTGKVSIRPEPAAVTVEGFTLRLAGVGDALPGGRLDVAVGADVAFDVAAGSLQVKDLSVAALGLEATGALRATGLADARPSANGTIAIATFNPRELLRALGQPVPDMADPNALTRADLWSDFTVDPTSLALSDLALHLDDSTLQGSAGLSDLATQAMRFDLALDRIDLDRYLPPATGAGSASAPAVATPGAAAAAAGPPEALRDLTLAGRLRVGTLKLAGLQLSELDINANAADGVMRLAPLGASLYQGRYAGNVVLDASGRQMRLSLDESLTGVQIGPLLRDLTGQSERLTGQANLRARLQAVGNDGDAMTRSLGGNAEFRFADGAVKGVNVAQYMREAAARLRGQPVPAESGPSQTDFTDMVGTVQIANGVARNQDLLVRSPLLRVAGEGSVDLGNRQIDYRIQASVVGTLAGQGGADLEALRGVTVPIRVTGSFDSPQYRLDVERLLAEGAKQQARDRIEQQIQDRVPENLQENLRRGLRGLIR
ncbi:AsmA family protein [Rhodocyclaceae bacterium SMB388]